MNRDALPLALRRHKLVATVRNSLLDRDVLVGVSGGADSVALLLLFCAAASQKSASFDVICAHIHHGLREEADDEQQMVVDLCVNLGVRCEVRGINVQPVSGSMAAGAREARYGQLLDIAKDLGVSTIAVAHHAADQLETMLMALCRGGGLKRLAGMQPSRQLSDDIALIRPLLHVDKEELEEVCRLADVVWCNDPTNDDPTTPPWTVEKGCHSGSSSSLASSRQTCSKCIDNIASRNGRLRFIYSKRNAMVAEVPVPALPSNHRSSSPWRGG